MTRLVNSDVMDMLSNVQAYNKTVQDAFYENYKNVYKLTKTNNFKGKGAEKYKDYLNSVTINYINAFLNITDEVKKTLEDMKTKYIEVESSETGSIDFDTLGTIKTNLGTKQNSFNDLVGEVEAVMAKASKYTKMQSLNTAEINGDYDDLRNETDTIKEDVESADADSLKYAQDLLNRINTLKAAITKVHNDYHKGGTTNAEKVKEIKAQSWYQAEMTEVLAGKLKDDPFYFDADSQYKGEGQWSAGFASDAYIRAGYDGAGYKYAIEHNGNAYTGKGDFTLINGYVNGQITDYAKVNGNIGLCNGAAEYKLKQYGPLFLGHASGNFSAAEAKGSVVLGSDKFNGYVKGNASALSANGKIACEFDDLQNFDGTLYGKASLFEASASAGTSAFSVPADKDNIKETKYAGGKVVVKEQTSLLEAKIGVKAGAVIEGGGGISSKTVIEYKHVKVNTVTIQGKVAVLLGLEGSVTLPYATLKW